MAGHFADGLSAGLGAEETLRLSDRRDAEYVGASDIVIAQGLADLLGSGEYENAVRLTDAALRRPEIWRCVNQLAEALGEFGLLEGDECEFDIYSCLPQTVPNWLPAQGTNIETIPQ